GPPRVRLAEDGAGSLDVGDGIACAEAGLGREGRALREVRPERPGELDEAPQPALVDRPGVGRRQADAAPDVGAALGRERADGRRDPLRVRRLDEPERAAEALVEDAQLVAAQPARPAALAHGSLRVKERLVEAVAVEGEPAQERVEPEPP